MKILILQLARLGDIYISWPAMRALRRKYPQAEIHMVTRARFQSALEGLTAVHRHWTLPTTHILSPLIQDEMDMGQSLERMRSWVTELRAENFDMIVNLTFSPFSSYLTHALAGENTQVTGYTRHQDGTFAIADDVTAYFYAQVGVEKYNRVHLADVFASMMDLQYTEEDWAPPEISVQPMPLPENFVAVHIGASEAHKCLTPQQWSQTLQCVLNRLPTVNIVLLGAESEKQQAQEIKALLPVSRCADFVGKTKLPEVFYILQNAQLLVGGDSAPMHMASLTDTPSLNISVGHVKFWETGPKASLSFIYRAETEADIHPQRLAEMTAQLLEGVLPEGLAVRAPGLTSYECQESAQDRFQWNLIQAIYMNGPYPLAERMELIQGAMKLSEINTFAMEQLSLVPTKGIETVAPYLERAEDVIQSISRIVPELSPLISWYQTEKVRIGPGTQEEVLTATLNAHRALERHLRVYIPHDILTEEGVGDGAL